MGYHINFGNHAFAVPGVVADHFIRLASETQLKVLLYLLRHGDEEVTAEQAAAFLHIGAEQAEEAFTFWAQTNVLDMGRTPVQTVPDVTAVPQPIPAAAPSPAVQKSSREIKLDPSEIAGMVEDSQDLKDLFFMAERTIGRPLNHMEQRSLIWMHSYLNIRSEVIMILLNYCISIEKYSIHYAETIALRWEQEGIVTMKLAEEEVFRMTKEHTYLTELRRMFEMKRNPTTKQKEYIAQWKAAGYPPELLQYAYEITIENIEKLNFKYIDTILKGWAEKGITTLEQAKQEQSSTPGKKPYKKKEEQMTEEEIEKMNAYLSLANQFEEDT